MCDRWFRVEDYRQGNAMSELFDLNGNQEYGTAAVMARAPTLPQKTAHAIASSFQ